MLICQSAPYNYDFAEVEWVTGGVAQESKKCKQSATADSWISKIAQLRRTLTQWVSEGLPLRYASALSTWRDDYHAAELTFRLPTFTLTVQVLVYSYDLPQTYKQTFNKLRRYNTENPSTENGVLFLILT